jgi:hypothetical protein
MDVKANVMRTSVPYVFAQIGRVTEQPRRLEAVKSHFTVHIVDIAEKHARFYCISNHVVDFKRYIIYKLLPISENAAARKNTGNIHAAKISAGAHIDKT